MNNPKVSLTKTYCQQCNRARGSAAAYRVVVFATRRPVSTFERLCPAHTMRLALPLPGRQVLVTRI